MTATQSQFRDAVDRDTARTIVKLVLSALGLLAVLALVSLLPGIDRVVPGTPVSIVALASAIVTVALVGLLFLLAPTLAALVRSTFEGAEQVVDDVASIVHLFVVLLAVLVAHRGLAPAIVPVLDGAAWAYDVVFFAIALGPLAILVARLYVSLDPISELLAAKIAGSSRD